ncbi:hypothetical protein Cgig2_026158 [Carnegiea gigantea]|uniref:Uncharacterized protein n=1 Tax=Carnegiea gigantea TaxID=171969 RepID=A0A9Q1JPH5_9CARY|nr:hypothetical protein Cgig2_026158 [Carnegiea gigantea]
MENYTCNCGLEADIFEGDRQYRRRYAWCPKRDEVACDFFHLIDADFPKQAKEVIDDLVREQTVQRDWLLDDRNAELLTRDEDMRMEAERRAEVDTLKKLLGLAVAVIAIMLAIRMRIDIEYGLKARVTHTSVKALLLTYSQLMSTPYEKDTKLMILHFQWVDHRMTKAEKISVTTLQAQNRALRADILTATTTLRRYMKAYVGVNVVVQDAIKCQLVTMSVCVTAYLTYLMISTAALI